MHLLNILRNCCALIALWFVLGAVEAGADIRIDENVCGSNSLSLIAYHVNEIPPDRVHALLDSAHAPFSLNDLAEAANTMGLRTALAQWPDKGRARFDCPAILHVRARQVSSKPDHFIACFGERDGRVCIADFPNRPRFISRERLLAVWDGHMLYVDRPNNGRIDDIQSNVRNTMQIAFALTVAVGGFIIVARRFRIAKS